jgi:SAM-dependent methyltransferase
VNEAPPGDARNAEQIAYWNGVYGLRWLARQEQQDATLAPVTRELLARAQPASGEFAVDVGCGCGDTTIELARRVAPGGAALGVDVSAPMLERARQRRPAGLAAEFVLGDATTHAFDAGRHDLLFSRFGVMFFAEPVRAFANLRRSLRAGGRCVFACWRAPRENPWLLVPLQQAYLHVPRMPEVAPGEPGPFAFADAARVHGILEAAGFTGVALEAVDARLDLANGRGLESAVDASMQIGPASRALEGQPDGQRAAARASIREALARHESAGTVALPAAFWIVTAINGGS